MKKITLILSALVLSLGLSAREASAGSILYFYDTTAQDDVNTDMMAKAIAASPWHSVAAPMALAGPGGFLDLISNQGSSFDLFILFRQVDGAGPSGIWNDAFAAVADQVNNYGKSAIIQDWGGLESPPFTAGHVDSFGANYTGEKNNFLDPNDSSNPVDMTFSPSSVADRLKPGMDPAGVDFFNPGWKTVATYGLKELPNAACGATFVMTGDCAIVLGERTIVNGFLSDTFKDPAQGQQLYFNEINALLPQPVPEPASLMLLGTGLAALAARHRRRKVQ